MTKPERITENRPLFVKLLPFWLFAFFAVITGTTIIYKTAHPFETIPGLTENRPMTESLFPVDRGSINMDSTRRFYYVAETLTNSGYLRCDVYLPSGKCPESADVEKTGNLFYEIRHKTKKGNHFLFSDAHEKPYHTYKTMVVNLESSGKAIGVVLYSDADESVFSEVLKTLANRQCNKNVIGKWYFIEDRAVLNHLENFYHMKFRNRSMPLQIIEKKGGHYRDADILAKNIINSLKSKTPVSKCLEI